MFRLFLILMLCCPVWSQETEVAASPTVELSFDVKIAWKSGQTIALKPRVMVADDKTGEIRVESNPKEANPWSCRIQAHPKVEGNQVHLHLETDMTAGSQTFHRSLDLTTVDEADNGFKDSNPQGDFALSVKTRIHNPSATSGKFVPTPDGHASSFAASKFSRIQHRYSAFTSPCDRGA